jgi:DNA invertase Pin-like site-specific DNA recombinase
LVVNAFCVYICFYKEDAAAKADTKTFKGMKTATKRKSQKLTPSQKRELRSLIKKYGTQVQVAESIGIHRTVFERLLIAGSASPGTVEKIDAFIESAKVD